MLLKKDVYNAQIKDIKNKKPIISSVTTTAALTNIKIIPKVSDFVKQTIIQKWKKSIRKEKKITTPNYNKFTNNILYANIK